MAQEYHQNTQQQQQHNNNNEGLGDSIDLWDGECYDTMINELQQSRVYLLRILFLVDSRFFSFFIYHKFKIDCIVVLNLSFCQQN